ncbi:hypothetical protein HY498_02985 [Candidatus Woesearchaeota archaeon]|nr:hypothetical protein [Candidatus Woesearchaeota archaeon]
MLKFKRGAIHWDYIVALVIILIIVIIYFLISNEIREGVINYFKEVFKGTFWG